MKRLLTLLLLVLIPAPLLANSLSSQADTGAAQKISQPEMEQVLNDYLSDQSALLPRVELHLASLNLPPAFEVPQGRIEQQVIPANPRIIGSRHLTLVTRVDDRVVSNQSIPVAVEALAEVAVVSGNLPRGTELTPENVSLMKVDISRLKQPIFNPEEIYGKRLKRSVRLGQPLQLIQIDFPPMIKRGDRVEIQVQRGALVLSAAGEARQNGQEGETIRVLNSSSRREGLCQVVAPGQVSVEF